MKLSTDRILTTHVGSLPRPAALFAPLLAENLGEAFDADALRQSIREARTARASCAPVGTTSERTWAVLGGRQEPSV